MADRIIRDGTNTTVDSGTAGFIEIDATGGGGGSSVPRFATNWYRVSRQKGQEGLTTGADPGAGRAWIIWLPGSTTANLEAIGLRVTTEGESGAKVRFAVYEAVAGVSASLDAGIGDLLYDSGQIAADTSGAKSVTGLSTPIPPEGLWLGYVGQSFTTTAPTIASVDPNASPGIGPEPNVGGAGDVWDNRGGSLYVTGVTGAWPSSLSGVGNNASGIGWLIPDFLVRYA